MVGIITPLFPPFNQQIINMIKLIIVAGLALLQTTVTLAQVKPDPAKADIKTTPTKKNPVNSPASRLKTPVSTTPPVTTPPAATTPALTSWDYFLSNAKVTFYTGNDNKEKESMLQMQLTFGKETVCNYYVPPSKYQECAVNSSTEFGFSEYHYKHDLLSLGYAEARGVKLLIFYSPNFPLDAWKIEKIMITLEFRDGNGNLHPTLGTKNIVFMNIGAVLNDGKRRLLCEADQFLMPRTATVVVGK